MVPGAQVLVVATGACSCALPLDRVIETMRPLPIEPLAGAAGFVLGVAIIRGVPTPVVDLGAMLGAAPDPAPARFVTVDSGGRRVALAVAGVAGVRDLAHAAVGELPPLLGDTIAAVDALGRLDGGLLAVLRRAQLVPPEALAAIEAAEVNR